MAGLRRLQRGVLALTLAVLLALQLAPVAADAFNSAMPEAGVAGAGRIIPLGVECDGDTCG